jgi:hypothetical protein
VRKFIVLAFMPVLTFSTAFLGEARAQSSPCDSSLNPAQTNPNSYRLQTDDPFRCEGIYTNKVAAAGNILLVLLTKGDSQLPPRGSVTVSWQSPSKSETRLRAYSLRDQLYYRMDSRLPADRQMYVWPLAIPAAVGLKAGEVGLVAWTSTDVFGRNRDVYLPFSSLPVATDAVLNASFVAPVALAKVTLNVSRLGNNGAASQSMGQKTKAGQFPPRRRIDFVLDSINAPGFYELRISGEDSSGLPWSDSYVVYRP